MTVRRIKILRSYVLSLPLLAILCEAGPIFAQAVQANPRATTTKAAQQTSRAAQTRLSATATQTVSQVTQEELVEAKVASGTNGILSQIKPQTAPEVRKSSTAGADDLSEQIRGLEATGQYVERVIRIPEGNNGAAKFVTFLIPIFRETGGKPMFDRERHYHRPEEVRTGGNDLPAVEAPIPAP